jgi:antitoxin component YwqK of YwqJK toxin-antitoxin module
MKRLKTDIPPEAKERLVREYSQEGSLISFQIRECILDGQVVGQRAYDSNGSLKIETPLRNGKKHGREYIWNEDGTLESVEPYFDGKLHGLSKQYGRSGKVIGTYRCVHGTGFDIWRQELEDGSIFISEIHNLRDGFLHGYEWWLSVDPHSVWHELHWYQGKLHGIERMWNDKGALKREYPKYWIQGQAVSKRIYMKVTKQDETLPIFREKDNRPHRQFPAEIENLLAASAKGQIAAIRR